jgi:hypothetical protein
MTEQVFNAIVVPSSTLVGAITSGASSLTVASAAEFSTAGFFRIRIDDELIGVATVSGAVFSSLTRGLEGTTAASHAANAPVTQVLTAAGLLALIAQNAGGGGSNVFVYQQGGTVAGNVYGSFATAYAALAAYRSANGGFTVLEINSLLGSCTTTAGTYDLTDVLVRGALEGGNGILGIAEGTIFTTQDSSGLTFYFDRVTLELNNTSTPVIDGSNEPVMILRAAEIFSDSGTGLFCNAASGGLALYMYDGSYIDGGPDAIIGLGAAGSFSATVLGGSTIDTETLSGTSGSSAFVEYDDTSTIGAQSFFSSTLTLDLLSLAQSVGYSPATPSDWASPPTQVAQALDDLAGLGAIKQQVSATSNEATAPATSGGTTTVLIGPVTLTPTGTSLFINAAVVGSVTAALYRMIPFIEYSVDGGVTYNQYATGRAAGLPSSGSYSGTIDVAINLTRMLTGLTPGTPVYVRLSTTNYGTSGNFSSAVGDGTSANVLTVVDFG